MEFRHSICNEAFDKWPFADACKAIRKAGYTGIEIAPFTLAETPGEITAAQRAEYRDTIRSAGLSFAGLHWLMVSPKGLHVTGPPNQRASTGGLTREQATGNFIDGLAGVAPHAESRGVKVLVEALPIAQSDVVQTLAEAVAIVEEIGSPAIGTMFDVHNAIDERESHAALVDRYFDFIRHV